MVALRGSSSDSATVNKVSGLTGNTVEFALDASATAAVFGGSVPSVLPSATAETQMEALNFLGNSLAFGSQSESSEFDGTLSVSFSVSSISIELSRTNGTNGDGFAEVGATPQLQTI